VNPRDPGQGRVGVKRSETVVGTPPRAGQGPILSTALAIGLLLLGIQLWMLTVALELYLAGHGERLWALTAMSFIVFLGGLFSLRLLSGRLFRRAR
jgi:hypothetical protein